MTVIRRAQVVAAQPRIAENATADNILLGEVGA